MGGTRNKVPEGKRCGGNPVKSFLFYEVINREVQRRPVYECPSVGVMKDYKLKLSDLHSSYTLGWGLEHLKIETRLIDERFASVMGVYYESIKRELQIRPIYTCR